MPRIEPVVKGSAPSLLEAEKANQLIRAINGLASIRSIAPIKARVFQDWSGAEIEIDMESLKTQLANIGGGLPSGFDQVSLDYVDSSNQAATATFLINTGGS